MSNMVLDAILQELHVDKLIYVDAAPNGWQGIEVFGEKFRLFPNGRIEHHPTGVCVAEENPAVKSVLKQAEQLELDRRLSRIAKKMGLTDPE